MKVPTAVEPPLDAASLGEAGLESAHVRGRGCRRPVRLRGRKDRVDARTGEMTKLYDSADELDGITYVACRNRRASECPSCTENHRNHVHINVMPGAPGEFGQPVGLDGAACDEVVYPVPAKYVGNDNHNWHETGPYWSNWHTGTDFSARCGTTVYAAHAGTMEIDTTQGWAGPQLVKVTTGAGSLTTWYAHMQTVTVSRGQTVAAGEPIGEVGKEGNVSGCHLHFEVHLKNGDIYGSDNVDPSTWLAENASRPTRSA